ncbi:Molybdenum cofactor biosysynthesis protein [Sphingobium herbicidovorans NBRC 16415]|uniref:Molybdenum cofactor biosysynthesis protein n=1 Tax=Sphingobium herbicidovorans (strain ATCC 700291 / DSM 11019 / CCUG 56400 / KCTC 2939 / LMG 18315 / NBRC 16415 / MH) TaxID=1219045 RepID=A0A086P8N4_SPHHM|nr:MOSC domain-containing protein [Sphingobium herbicidovorans]KFG89752.1 Molybdenum cofactor biosysynthesis protein [Sphingobium herbicidovorans NBRC 16415]
MSDHLIVEALLTGTPVPFRDGDYSAIAKRPVNGVVRIGWLGLAGDGVADPIHHGGWDKAIHLYPQDHYGWWRERKPDHPLLAAPGAFGENIASHGMTEEEICLGDRFSLGSALVEVSHGRQPCWKLDHRFGSRDVMATIVKTGRSGLYFRVLREGEAEANSRMELLDRPLPQWPIARIFRLLIGGGHKAEPDAVRSLAELPVLAEVWRDRARKLA